MDRRTLYAEALSALLKGEMAKLALARNFEVLAEVARLAVEDAPVALATSDPALYTSWRAAVTRYHVAGWTRMTPERIADVSADDKTPQAGTGPGEALAEDDKTSAR
jgi:hypothetical protein